MYLMNHRSATNGTPLDARHTNVALEARKLGYRPALFGYTDTSVDPRTVPPGDDRLRHYEGVLPGFDPVCHLPEGDPHLWLSYLGEQGYDLGDDWRAFVDHPVDAYTGTDEWGPHRAPTRYAAEHSQTAFLTDRLLEFVDAERTRAPDDGWFAHLSYLRPHPPFYAPEPYNTMFDPMTVPMPVRAESREAEGAQHPLVAALVNHPFLTSPDDERHLRQLRATYYGMQAEVDDQLGRILDHLDATGEADRTIVVMTSDHGEMLGDHYLLHKLGWFDSSYHVPLIVRDPRAEADAHRGETVEAYTEHVDVLPTLLDLLGAEVPLQCDGRPLTGFLHDGTRDEARGVRKCTSSSTSAMPAATCSSAPSTSRSRSARSRCCATTTASTCTSRGCRRSSSTSTTIRRRSSIGPATLRTRRRSWRTRSGCSRGGCSTRSARSRA